MQPIRSIRWLFCVSARQALPVPVPPCLGYLFILDWMDWTGGGFHNRFLQLSTPMMATREQFKGRGEIVKTQPCKLTSCAALLRCLKRAAQKRRTTVAPSQSTPRLGCLNAPTPCLLCSPYDRSDGKLFLFLSCLALSWLLVHATSPSRWLLPNPQYVGQVVTARPQAAEGEGRGGNEGWRRRCGEI